MGFKSAMMGTPGKLKAMPTMSSEQQQLFSQLLGGMGGLQGQGMEYLQQMLSGSPESTQSFEAPFMRQFNEQIVPGLAERFSGMGAGGAQSSSAFGQQMGAQGAGLMEQLASLRGNMRQNSMQQLMQLMGLGMQTPTHQWMQIPGRQGWLNPLMQGLGSGIGQAGGMAAMGAMF